MKVDSLKRWGPLAGSAVLAIAVILRMLGLGDVAGVLEFVGSFLGVPADFVAELVKLPAALAAITGVGLKLYSIYKEAREADEYVRRP
jgi:hypothetical protein